MKFLVTGVAGFIGFHVTQNLLNAGHEVIGLDNLNNCNQDIHLKTARLTINSDYMGFSFQKVDISDHAKMREVFQSNSVQRVIHLAAQTGVRYSLQNPMAYTDANLVGHLNILECCRYSDVEHVLYASSSSIYGLNRKMPFCVDDDTTHPISIYAATKKANELMSHAYSHLYGTPTTGLRFFTVYGPWGRQDMALFKFTQAILSGKRIDIYNYGQMQRDFTYIDDIVQSIMVLHNAIPKVNPDWTVEGGRTASSSAPYQVFNIGNGHPVTLMNYIEALEDALGIVADKNMLPMQPGDIISTSSDNSDLVKIMGYQPYTEIQEGVRCFVKWYKDFYQIQ
ncbi:GDP-mannose 4,6 dehydratase domain-containing protein [Candidatus Erwinia haradaeae]|uniref:GDP-mannose 4,6 dehydratase domain-containing protein n=1 Tax=Candidatus Erwinia haradaeae TaxID=1922217 RepID=A0A451DJ68_9GAMM|nr:NAD-dependent epimerase/dehydratase family protein [Candidatus Erwinia haradaeae]VFP86744.1 GDP-mannose 4,6 dehydratase domain-containing protein [Candidatus Erwinia haradaeae]